MADLDESSRHQFLPVTNWFQQNVFRSKYGIAKVTITYTAFHGYGQGKYACGGLVSGYIVNFDTAASKNTAQFKSGQNWSKNDHLAFL